MEDADAHLINLNVTSAVTPEGEIIADLRVNRRNAAAVARSLERYGFRVIELRNNADDASDVLSERVGELLAYLNI